MKMLPTEELRAKDDASLKKELYAALQEIFNLRVQKAVNEVKDTSQFRLLKRYVARIKTILHENIGKPV